MKIISKHKDYFDHLVSYYGYDDHIIWDRRNEKPLNFKWSDRFLFYICGVKVPVVKVGREFIFDPKHEALKKSKTYDAWWMEKYIGKKSDINALKRQPILCTVSWEKGLPEIDRDFFIPCLADFGFAGVVGAHHMYEKVYAFLGWLKDNPEIPNKQNDKEKVVSHGFDVKTSFRPTMKI